MVRGVVTPELGTQTRNTRTDSSGHGEDSDLCLLRKNTGINCVGTHREQMGGGLQRAGRRC